MKQQFHKNWKLLLSEWLFAFWISSGSTKGKRIQLTHFISKKAAKLTNFFEEHHSSKKKFFGTLGPNYFSFFSLFFDWWISEITHAIATFTPSTPPPSPKKTLTFRSPPNLRVWFPSFWRCYKFYLYSFPPRYTFPTKRRHGSFQKAKHFPNNKKSPLVFSAPWDRNVRNKWFPSNHNDCFSRRRLQKINTSFLRIHFWKSIPKLYMMPSLLGERKLFSKTPVFSVLVKFSWRVGFFSSIGFSCILWDTQLIQNNQWKLRLQFTCSIF